MKKGLLAIVLLLVTLSSCRLIRPNIMMKTPKGYQFDIPKDSVSPEYRIQPNDIIDFRIFTNDGFKLIDLTSLNVASNSVNINTSLDYTVEFDGKVKLPMLGRTAISGLTLRQAEFMLEEKYSDYYIKPFIILKIINKKVFVFSGNSEKANIVILANDETNVVQALASAGGITNDGKAYKVKVLRGELKNPQVFLFDLSTIEGIKKAGMTLQSNDIIYVEPIPRLGRGIVAEIAPYVSLISSIFIVITFSRSLK
jgi:polysaccharide export outer membrane protein